MGKRRNKNKADREDFAVFSSVSHKTGIVFFLKIMLIRSFGFVSVFECKENQMVQNLRELCGREIIPFFPGTSPYKDCI